MSDVMERLRSLADLFEAAHAPRHLVLHMRAGADEIERLRAGGCARDQDTTQYCAEAAKLAADNERLRAALRPFADALKGNWSMQPGSMEIVAGPWASDLRMRFTLADFRNTSYALEGAAPSAPAVALRCSGGKVSQMSERMTEAEFNELTVRRVNRDGTAERLCSKAHAEITRLRADLAARDAEVARLREDIDTWKSVFPNTAPSQVLPDRSLVEIENKRLRAALRGAEGQMAMGDMNGGWRIIRAALEEGRT